MIRSGFIYLVDYLAEVPLSGSVSGDLFYCVETDKVYRATSAGAINTSNEFGGGGGGSASWGGIGGNIANQTDLQTALDGKAASAHAHAQSDVTGLVSALAGKSDTGHTHGQYELSANKGAANGYASLNAQGQVPAAQLPSSSGSGAKATYIDLVNHFTTLENTTSANATWKIPAATTYGQVSQRLDMTKLGTPASAELCVVYTNTATSGSNQIGLRIGSVPVAAGTTVTPITSSVATMANSATYPQTIVKAITVSELGTSAVWLQWCLNIATSTVGPNVMSLSLVLYY